MWLYFRYVTLKQLPRNLNYNFSSIPGKKISYLIMFQISSDTDHRASGLIISNISAHIRSYIRSDTSLYLIEYTLRYVDKLSYMLMCFSFGIISNHIWYHISTICSYDIIYGTALDCILIHIFWYLIMDVPHIAYMCGIISNNIHDIVLDHIWSDICTYMCIRSF